MYFEIIVYQLPSKRPSHGSSRSFYSVGLWSIKTKTEGKLMVEVQQQQGTYSMLTFGVVSLTSRDKDQNTAKTTSEYIYKLRCKRCTKGSKCKERLHAILNIEL